MRNVGEQFALEIEKWEEVKYQHRGSTLQGCDCTGLIIGAIRNLGYMKDYALRIYQPDWNLHNGAGDYIVKELLLVCDEITKSEVRRGDIIVFQVAKCIDHVGVVIRDSLFIHQFVKAGKVKYGKLKDSQWSRRWKRVFRLNENKLSVYR